MSENVVHRDLQFVRDSDDFGPIYEMICPTCEASIRLSATSYWSTECGCGYKWSLVIYAEGSKHE